MRIQIDTTPDHDAALAAIVGKINDERRAEHDTRVAERNAENDRRKAEHDAAVEARRVENELRAEEDPPQDPLPDLPPFEAEPEVPAVEPVTAQAYVQARVKEVLDSYVQQTADSELREIRERLAADPAKRRAIREQLLVPDGTAAPAR